MQRANEVLKFTCLHCHMEYLSIGIEVEQVQACICPKCGGYCELEALSFFGLRAWLEQYLGRESLYEHK